MHTTALINYEKAIEINPFLNRNIIRIATEYMGMKEERTAQKYFLLSLNSLETLLRRPEIQESHAYKNLCVQGIAKIKSLAPKVTMAERS